MAGVMSRMDARWEMARSSSRVNCRNAHILPVACPYQYLFVLKEEKKIKINEGVKSAGLVCSIILTPAELLIIIPQLILVPGYNISLLLLAFAIILILNS
jgi:hypothetical protein